MAKLISLKLDPAEKKEMAAEAKGDVPRYPCWSCIYLSDEELKKFGLSADLKTGTIINVVGEARVTGRSEREQEGTKYQSLDIQLTDLSLTERKPRVEDVIYPNGGQK